MSSGAAVANALWLATGFGAARRFHRALGDPGTTQTGWLQHQVQQHATSAFGQSHDFATIRTVADFTRRVPLSRYDDVAPAVEGIRRGERNVLTVGRVTHLAPTSGSSGARKLIPFSASLQTGFNRAVSAWMHDLARQRPALVAGPAYWSVSPLSDVDAAGNDSPDGVPDEVPDEVRIGFADDADYLGQGAAWLVRQALAAPSSLRHVRDGEAFWALTTLALLRRRPLRLISIWHPSFLDLLVEAAARQWPLLLDAIASGECPWLEALPPGARAGWRVSPDPRRSRELRHVGTADWSAWWPRLQVVSCWGEQGAEPGWRALVRRLPHVLVQPKGLLATEGVVTLPLGSVHVLAVTSHFFEFLDARGDVRLAHQLEQGAQYEVVITNGGGLWRYRLGDVVECTGHLQATPTLRFLGRAGRVSDLRGEKLSEPFVAETLRTIWGDADPPAYAALRAWSDQSRAGYELLVSDEVDVELAEAVMQRLESALRANPHYALARRLGQLDAVRAVRVARDAAFADIATHTGRVGDAKPRLLIAAEGIRA